MMHWQYSPYVLPLVMAAVTSFAVALFAWRRRPAPGAMPLAYVMLAATEWSLGYALGMASADLSSKVFWAKVQYVGIVTVPVMWLIFALQYTNREKWLTRRNLALLTIVPLLTLLLAWTNDGHRLIWSDTRLDTDQPFSVLYLSYGAFFWVWVVYSYLLVFFGSISLLSKLVRSLHLYRQQALALLVAALAPWVGNMLRISGLNPFPHLDLTNFAFTLSGLMAAWALFRFHLLDLVPVAYDKVIKGMGDGMLVLDAQNRIVDINPAAEKLIGVDGESAIGQHAEAILATWAGLAYRYHDPLVAQTEVFVEGTGYIDLRITPLYERGGRFSGRLIILRDITERKRAEETIKRMAYHDDLTSLPNRRLFNDRLNLALAHAHRNQHKLAVMLLDLDHFKEVNDTLGHSVGDRLLQAAGQRLANLLRESDTVARMGGDEFILLLPEVAQEEDVAKVARKILETIREPFVFGGHELRVATSIGIALYPDDGEDGDTLMKNADIAMYRAKDLGRDSYQRCTSATKAEALP